MPKPYKYRACFMSDIAERAGVDIETFQSWLTPQDMHCMIDLGWVYYRRKLTPPVVQYLMDKFCPDYKD